MNALLRHVRDLGFSSAENTMPTCVFGMLPKRNTVNSEGNGMCAIGVSGSAENTANAGVFVM